MGTTSEIALPTALSEDRSFSSHEVGCRASGIKAKKELFEQRYGAEEKGTQLFFEFLDEVYMPWSQANKKSWRDDAYMVPMLKKYFEGKALREISAS